MSTPTAEGRCSVSNEPDGVIADRKHKRIVIYISDEGAAYDIATAFGRNDLFYAEVMHAAYEIWGDPNEDDHDHVDRERTEREPNEHRTDTDR